MARQMHRTGGPARRLRRSLGCRWQRRRKVLMHPVTLDPRSLDSARVHTGESDFLWKTYRWMSIGLALTGLVAWSVAATPSLIETLLAQRGVFYGALIAEFVLVVVFAARASRMSFGS